MIKSIVFYIHNNLLIQSEFVRHEEAITFLNSLNGKKGITDARLVSSKNQTAELYVLDAD